MALSLEQYATWLDGRTDLLWPAAPMIKVPKARAHLKRLRDIRVATFNVYGTLLTISGGELAFVHTEKFMMEAALEKTIQEFKMWQSMSRKPGKPSEYMGRMYEQILGEVRIARASGSERQPEFRSEDVWERIAKRLIKNEYQFDVGFYGSLNQLCEKVSYFFHSSLQGTGAQPGELAALRALKERGVMLGLIADAQCFTRLQLLRALAKQGRIAALGELFDPEVQALSCEVGAKRPSERLFRALLPKLHERGIAANQVLHVGSNLPNDLAPARRLGFHTALFAGDKSSLVASKQQVNDPASRPDVLITEMSQLAEIIG